jgi:hypothetical protein
MGAKNESQNSKAKRKESKKERNRKKDESKSKERKLGKGGEGHTISSKSHSRNTALRRPHSMERTSARMDALVKVSWTPEKSTVRGWVGGVFCSEC